MATVDSPVELEGATAAAATSTSSDGLTRSMRKNGRFVNPWPGWALPSFTGSPNMFHLMWKFTTGSGDQSSIPSQQVLDTTLPIVTPDFSSPVPEDGMKVTWLGHASVLVQFENISVLTDPIFSQRAAPFQFMGPKRYRGPPCSVQDLPDVDVVVISHNHYDHLDYNTVKDLHKRFGERLHWHVPLGLSPWMKSMGCENVVEQDWWQEECVKDRDDIKVVLTPAAHWCKRGPTDDNLVLWGSWCVIGRRSRFFFGGDTGYCHGFKEIGKKYGPFNLAAIPIGAYEPRDFMKNQHVNPEEAVQIHKDVQAKQSLGIHWGTFKLTFEGYLEPRSKVKEAMEAKGLKVEDFFTLDHGGSKVIPIPQADPSIEKETAT
ncbi:N-acyl-phosphatidylethanolamine-hydrolyzing phospholipase D-like isoform X2 [Branchiostoma floridae x Branchiostoma belcheri]